jgi:GNAT superfamily N-acetyltransferase
LGTSTLQIEPARLADRDASALVAEVQAEYTLLYGGPDDSLSADEALEPPAGAFFVGYVDGVAVAMGGWRRRSDVAAFGRHESAEIKRMFVVPHARRRGHARAMLRHLEQTARAAGADLMVLETGTMQPEAIALYEADGYARIDDFGYYAWSPLSRCYGKPLRPRPAG